MLTYNDLYLNVRRQLKQADCPGAELEARELVCFASGKTKEEFLRDARLYASPEVERKTGELVRRHLNGEPVAYILGEWEFYGLTLDIDESVLIPRPDSEVLVDAALAYLRPLASCRVLDLCAGSGCIGLALASFLPACRAVLSDVSERAVRLCRRNIRRTGLAGRASAIQLDVLSPPPRNLGEFDCVTCNPPYIPAGDIEGLDVSVRGFEPRLALCGGEDGLDFYRAVLGAWTEACAVGGWLCFEVGFGQADTVASLMRAAGFGDLSVAEDPGGVQRVVSGRRAGTL